jgi:hypothetical protein
MCICVFTNKTTFWNKQIHKDGVEEKNIRRDGKQRFVNLRIFYVFTNKITAFCLMVLLMG